MRHAKLLAVGSRFFGNEIANGIAKTLQVNQVPAVFLAEPFTGKITPLGFGVLSEAQLLERIGTVATPGFEAMVPSATRHVSLQ